MSEKDKIMWVTCPDCGSKIGIIISVGKETVTETPSIIHEPTETDSQGSVRERLDAAGIDLELVNVEEGEAAISISPKRFLGDLWSPINTQIKTLGGVWIRDGRNSRWEIALDEDT
jgi:hypothetical protein